MIKHEWSSSGWIDCESPEEDILDIGYRGSDDLYVGLGTGSLYSHRDHNPENEGWQVFVRGLYKGVSQ